MGSPTEEIKSRLDVVEFIQTYVRLAKAGMNYKANCPFHAEKTPSFFVSPSRQIWHCFGGCGEGGDIFKFVMKIEGLDFPEALRLLAQRAGVVLKHEDPAIRSARNRLYDACEHAAAIFEKSLSLTPAVRGYLEKRGLAEETIRAFRIGFTPKSWDFLTKSLGARGFSGEEIEKAGLAVRRGSTQINTQIGADLPRGSASSPRESADGWYDRFRGRIMFPITDVNGRVIGFGGRIFESGIRNQELGKTEAKYINIPQTVIYDKSRALYGLDKAKQEIRSQNRVVVVEGYMDCVMSHQAGVANTIAVSGTALTSDQLKVLRRLCDTMVSSFDTDAAGESATKRSLVLAGQFEFERRVVHIPSGKDPADTVKENPQAWHEAVARARPVMDFYFEKAFRVHDPATVEGKKEISKTLLPFLAECANEIEKSHWVSQLAEKFAIPQEAVWEELRKAQQSGPSRMAHAPMAEEGRETRVKTRKELLEDRFLTLLSLVPPEVRVANLQDREIAFTSSMGGQLFAFFKKQINTQIGADLPRGSASSPRESADGGDAPGSDSPLHAALASLQFKAEVVRSLVHDSVEELGVCARELEKECVRERLGELSKEIGRQERAKEEGSVGALLQDFRALSEKLKLLS